MGRGAGNQDLGARGLRGRARFVDRKDPALAAVLATAPIFCKQGTVTARQATRTEEVVTVLANGVTETVNTARPGEWIITNPGGEQYVLENAKFLARYEATEIPGTYRALGYCRAVRNPFGRAIEIMASWGEPQAGDAQCWIADVCDVEGQCEGEPYLIESEAFAATYAPAAT